jgi:FixJ family two-component response regulator
MDGDAPDKPATLLVVDDDESFRRALRRLLTVSGYTVETFASANEFLAREPLTGPGCLILDVLLPGLDGLDLHALLRSAGTEKATVFLSGHGDVPTSVRAMKGGAVDFLTKPVDDAQLLDAIERALARDRRARQDREELQDLRRRADTLTPREREVCALVATGRLNKQIGALLGTSEKTVKAHRARVMAKMRVTSLAELVRVVDRLGMRYPAVGGPEGRPAGEPAISRAPTLAPPEGG